MRNCIAELTVAIIKLGRHDFQHTDKVFSSVAKRIYDCILGHSTISLNCHGANFICLITTNRCYF